MIAPPSSPIVSRGSGLSAIYLPPLCPMPPELVDRRMQVVVPNIGRPMVSVVPPAVVAAALEPTSVDRVVLALAPQLLDARLARALPQEACDPYLFNIARTIGCGFRVGQLPPAAYLDSLGFEIADHLRHHYPVGRRRRERHGLSDNRLARARALIEERLAEPLAVNDIAAAVHLSPFHFARMFRRSTNMSPHEFITARRIEKAKTLLGVSAVPIADIARRVGYRTQAHFTRVFHEETGTTPLRYRGAHRSRGRPHAAS